MSILGANGAGKTTTLLTISGLVRASGGAVRFQGEDLHTLPSHEVVRRGLTQSPEGRRVFGVLSVLENLRLGAFTVGDKEKAEQTLDWIFDLFPRLHERKDQLAGTLSGGEQQMLAIGRALMGQPKLLLLDEPSLGLAPLLVKSIFETIRAINRTDWFCGNYHKYNDLDNILPCDQHMLIAAIAPRLCYVESCSEDLWAALFRAGAFL